MCHNLEEQAHDLDVIDEVRFQEKGKAIFDELQDLFVEVEVLLKEETFFELEIDLVLLEFGVALLGTPHIDPSENLINQDEKPPNLIFEALGRFVQL